MIRQRKETIQQKIALFFGLLTMMSAAVYAQQTPGSVTLTYDVKMNGLTLGEATHIVSIHANKYSITSVEKATGIVGLFANQITRKSQGTIVNQKFRPSRYSETAKNKTRTATLDWTAKTATFTTDENKVDTFDTTAVDRVTFPYQYYLAQKMPPSGTYQQMIVDVKRAEEQLFKNAGKETVDTPMGKIETIRIERAGDSKNMKIWLSPAHDYLPVRVMYIDNKDNVFDQVIVEIVKTKAS